MAHLNTKPGSSSALQHRRLVVAGKRKGLDLTEIRRMVGGSVKALSASEASEWITKLTGRDLPNPPGQKPRARAGRPRQPGIIPMIQPDHVEQIERLMLMYFEGDVDHAANWLDKMFKVRTPQQLGTAQLGGKVLSVLKQMHHRKEAKG